MPLSFAAILGGMLTKIGTTTNLLVIALADDAKSSNALKNRLIANTTRIHGSRLLNHKLPNPVSHKLTICSSGEVFSDFFSIGLDGLPLCIFGGIYLIIFAPILLSKRRYDNTPSRRPSRRLLMQHSAIEVTSRLDAFTACVKVEPALYGKSVESSRLGHLFEESMVLQEIIHEEITEESDVIVVERSFSTDIQKQMHKRSLSESNTNSESKRLDHSATEKKEESKMDINDLRHALHTVVLKKGDLLVLSGSAKDLTTVMRDPRLEVIGSNHASKLDASFHKRKLVIAVIADESRLHDMCVGDIQFRNYYHAAIIGIRRKKQAPTSSSSSSGGGGGGGNSSRISSRSRSRNTSSRPGRVHQLGWVDLRVARREYIGRLLRCRLHHHLRFEVIRATECDLIQY